MQQRQQRSHFERQASAQVDKSERKRLIWVTIGQCDMGVWSNAKPQVVRAGFHAPYSMSQNNPSRVLRQEYDHFARHPIYKFK